MIGGKYWKKFILKYSMKWNISVIEGTKIKKDSVSTGEGLRRNKKQDFFEPQK